MASLEDIEEQLDSDDPEEIYAGIIDAGKELERGLVPRIAPYLTSDQAMLREAAVRTLALRMAIPEYKAQVVKMLTADPNRDVRQAAAMALYRWAEERPILDKLVEVAVDAKEEELVRAAAFYTALIGAGVDRADMPRDAQLPDFEERTNFKQLAQALEKKKLPVSLPLARLAARTK